MRQLPLNRVVRLFRKVQLQVDRATGTYKFFALGYVSMDDAVKAEVYDSSLNEWSTLSSGLFLVGGPQVYDCSNGQFRCYYPRPRGHAELENDQCKIHLNDLYIMERLSELGAEVGRFAVCKYEDGNWRFGQDGSHEVARAPAVYECHMRAFGETSLFVSKAFIMVYEHAPERPEEGFQMMLYDVEKGEWHSQGNQVYTLLTENFQNPISCELRWGARP